MSSYKEQRDLEEATQINELIDRGECAKALFWCAIYGRLNDLKSLIESEKIYAAVDNNAAIRWSSHNDHLDLVKYLAENGADIRADDDIPLKWSAGKGHLHVVKYLKEKGALISSDDDYPLRISCQNGHFSVVKYLIENGANIRAKIYEPLTISAENHRNDIAKYLIDLMNTSDLSGLECALKKVSQVNGTIAEYLRAKIKILKMV